MKFTLNTLGAPAWTLEQTAQRAAEYGYDGVDIRLIDGEVITPELVRRNRERIKRLFLPERLPVAVLGTSVKLAMDDPAARDENESQTREFLTLAQELGVPLVRVYGGLLGPLSLEQGMANTAQSLNLLAPDAERAGVGIVLETHDDFCRSATVQQIMAQVPSRWIGVAWDVHHTNRFGDTIEEVWQRLGARIQNVHIKDARRNPQARTGWDLVLLGEGDVPVAAALHLLRAQGYAGCVSMEWEKKWHPEIPDPEIAYPQHLAKVREYLATDPIGAPPAR